MSVFRVERTKDYTVMSNLHLKEKEMSLKAKGLLSIMLSLPEDWDYSVTGLVAICKENETSITTTLNELKRFGYLQIIKLMPNETESGRIEYLYIVYEKPTYTTLPRKDYINMAKQGGKKQDLENLGVEFLGVEFLGIENQGQYNINNNNINNNNINNKDINNKILNTNILNTPPNFKTKSFGSTLESVPPTKEKEENIFIKLPLNDKTDYNVSRETIDELKEIYPAVNVEQEFLNMKGWLIGNPTKRKTKKGIMRFVTSWLAKRQDKPTYNQTSNNRQIAVGEFANKLNEDAISFYDRLQ